MVCDIHPKVGNLLAAKVATGLVPNRGSVRRYAHGPLRRSADVRISRCERAIRNAPIIRRQSIFGRDREKRSRGEPMKGTLYPEEWVEGHNHWFSGPPHLRLDGLAGFVRILVSSRGSRHSGKTAENALRRVSGSRFCANVAQLPHTGRIERMTWLVAFPRRRLVKHTTKRHQRKRPHKRT
jgi:hypothetical protein